MDEQNNGKEIQKQTQIQEFYTENNVSNNREEIIW